MLNPHTHTSYSLQPLPHTPQPHLHTHMHTRTHTHKHKPIPPRHSNPCTPTPPPPSYTHTHTHTPHPSHTHTCPYLLNTPAFHAYFNTGVFDCPHQVLVIQKGHLQNKVLQVLILWGGGFFINIWKTCMYLSNLFSGEIIFHSFVLKDVFVFSQ